MNKKSDFTLTPEQQKVVDKKVRDLAEAVKNIDFNNLPKRENHPEASKPVSGSNPAKKV
ncbi:hypothetical protein ACN9ML_27830 [Dyadobacter endophyticus]|uniref:Uncharacterized protein n=1 Tax=Dyadobacter endophyticus TaxID=1749036 RepID=A0ABQ1YVR5_9BACT|nr:hypothetical protein [Dyadobacter endophyticus]GGH38387.1 hypothetical protein GCM10007423_32060 [Dyadobacter endophyticus]